jgi:NADPH:quinone reductase-like Zn-dependent oxidoreductase
VRAAVLTVHGEPPDYREHPDPAGGDGRALVRMTAAPLVQLDLLLASGRSYFGPPALPYVPGDQGVGEVVRSATLAPGSRVFVETGAGRAAGDGSMAELCAVPEENVVPVREDVPEGLTAAVGMQGVAAWMCLMRRAQLQPGERVLVLGAGGAVGQAGIGVARAAGAARVVGACRTDASAERARRAGADDVVLLTGDVEELSSRFAAACDGSVDVVLDPVFGAAATAAARVLAPGGRLVNLGGLGGDSATFSSSGLRSRTAAVLGYTNVGLTPARRREALDAVLALAAEGRLTVAADEVSLADVADAWRLTASGQAGVRIVLRP